MYIYSLGHYFPPHILDNEFFDHLDIGSEGSWIKDRVGIETRHSVLTPDQVKDIRFGRTTLKTLKAQGLVESNADMNLKAWHTAVARNPVIISEVDTVLGGTSVPDDDIPGVGCIAAAKVGLENVQAFDVNSACSTFVVQCHVMRGLMDSGLSKEGVVFCAEKFTTRMDYSDRRNSILFGDAAVVAAMSSQARPHSLKVIDTNVESAPSGWEHIRLPVGEFFHQNGASVQKFAVTKTISAAEDILRRNKLKISDAHWFIGHQANYRMLTSAIEKMGVPQDRHLYNVVHRGNQGACGAPSVLSQNWDRYKSGDYIVVAVVGAGLTWGAMLLQKQ
jgi:3-oxoacyl-[acyl-carrier-protein] synthase III